MEIIRGFEGDSSFFGGGSCDFRCLCEWNLEIVIVVEGDGTGSGQWLRGVAFCGHNSELVLPGYHFSP